MNQIPFVRIAFQLKSFTHIVLKASAHFSCTEREFVEVSSKVLGSTGTVNILPLPHQRQPEEQLRNGKDTKKYIFQTAHFYFRLS